MSNPHDHDSVAQAPADPLRTVPMSVIWGSAFFVVAVVGGVLTPWDALVDLISSQGVSDEGQSLLAFEAGGEIGLDHR